MPRSKGVILVTKPPKSEEKQAVLKRLVAQIHANAVIRRLSAAPDNADEKQHLLNILLEDLEKAQGR